MFLTKHQVEIAQKYIEIAKFLICVHRRLLSLHVWKNVFPIDFNAREEPETLSLHQAGISLIEKVRPTILINECAGMTAFGGVPLSRRTVWNERNVPESYPMNTIVALGNTDLLRIIIVAASIEHNKRVAALYDGCCLNTSGFPRQLRL